MILWWILFAFINAFKSEVSPAKKMKEGHLYAN